MELIDEVNRLVESGRLEDAAERVVRLLAEHGGNYRALMSAAGVATAQGNKDVALRHLRAAARRRRDRSEPHLRIGRLLASEGRRGEATASLERALALNPRDIKILTSLADLARAAGDGEGALAFIDRALALQPGEARLLLLKASELRALGEYRQSRDCLLGLLATPPAGERELRAAAAELGRLGEYDAEVRLLTLAESRSPDRLSTRLRLAAALRNAGRIREAVAILRDIRTRHPTAADAIKQLAQIVADAGSGEAVRDLVTDAELSQVRDADTWVNLVKAVDRTQPWTSVVEVIARAKGAADRRPRLMLAEIQALFDRGLDAAGFDRLQEAEADFPDHPAVRRYRIDIDTRFGRFEEALCAIRELPAASAEQRAVRELYRGKLEASRLHFDEAAAAFEAALAFDPFHTGALGGLARAHALRFRVEEARRCIVEANRLTRGQLFARGRSPNPSQSLLGEILNEFASDPHALAAARDAVDTPGLDPLLAVARTFPDYTGAAMALLIRMRRDGCFEASPTTGPAAPEAAADSAPVPALAPAPASCIPRRIHQFWDTPQLPPDVAELMSSWSDHNPTWEYRRFDNASARAYLAAHAPTDVQRAFRSARSVAQKADVFRLVLLQREGGVYADADDRCMGSLDGLVAGRSAVLRQEPWGTIGNNFIAVVPGHPFVERALTEAVAAVLRGDAETVWLSTGPGLVTRAFVGWLPIEPDPALQRSQVLLDWKVRDKCSVGCRAVYKASSQHWAQREFANLK